MAILGLELEKRFTIGNIVTILVFLAGIVYAVAQRDTDMDVIVANQTTTHAQLLKLSDVVGAMDKTIIRSTATEFSTNDWIKANGELSTRFSMNENRLTKLEGNMDSIKESLTEIKNLVRAK